MKSKYDIDYKQETEEKVINLVKEFNKVKDKAYREMYLILKEIYDLRKKENEFYSYNSLAREKGIDVSVNTIKYLFGYEYFTPETKEHIKKGNINERSALALLRRSQEFRDKGIQNKTIKAIVNKKISMTEISNTPSDIVLRRVNGGKGITENEKYFLETYYQLRRIHYRIKSYKDYFLTAARKEKLIKYLEMIIKEIGRTEKEFKYIHECEKCKRIIKGNSKAQLEYNIIAHNRTHNN